MEKTPIPDEDKIHLQEMITEINFIYPDHMLQPLRCENCNQIAIANRTLQCSHVLCSMCYCKFHLKRCPGKYCNNTVPISEYIEDEILDEHLIDMKAYCRFKKHGCDEVPTLNKFLEHFDNCRFSTKTSVNGVHHLYILKEELSNELYRKLEIKIMNILETQPKQMIEKINNDFNDLKTNLENQQILKFKESNEVSQEQLKIFAKSYFEAKSDEMKENISMDLSSKINEHYKEVETNLQQSMRDKCEERNSVLLQHLSNEMDMKIKESNLKTAEGLNNSLADRLELCKSKMEKSLMDTLQASNRNQLFHIEERVSQITSELQNKLEQKCVLIDHEMHTKIKESNLQGAVELNKSLADGLESCKSTTEKSIIGSLQAANNNQLFQTEDRFLWISFELQKLRQMSPETGDLFSNKKEFNVLKENAVTLFWEAKLGNDFNPEIPLKSEIYNLPCGQQVKFTFDFNYVDFGVSYFNFPGNTGKTFDGAYKINFTLFDQSQNNESHDIFRVFEPYFHSDWNLSLSYPTFRDKVKLADYIKNGKVKIKIQLEPLVPLLKNMSADYGKLIWRIDHVQSRRATVNDPCAYSLSRSFYSSEMGYRMRVLFHFGSEVKFRLCFFKGLWDDALPKNFPHIATWTFISQTRDLKDRKFTRKTDWVYPTYFFECGQFSIHLKEVEKYVKNDSLKIMITVKGQ